MPALVTLALAASLTSALERWRRTHGGLDLEGVVIAGALWLAGVGVVTTLLAIVGEFGARSTTAALVVAAVAAWPWTHPRPRGPTWSWRRLVPILVVLAAGLALRWPPADYGLAGRDQGTYTLRAQHTLRTGRLDARDPVLAAAGREAGQRPGPEDLRGLYPRRGEPWRRDLYEAAYRPGFYLADIDRGAIRAQFFHLHPMLMATAGLVLSPDGVTAVVLVYAGLALLAMVALARRLWSRGPWAWLAIALWTAAPLAIWVQRTALSEGPATVLVLAAAVAVLRAHARAETGPLVAAALLLGANAWTRGNGWLAAPIVLAAQWLVPADARARRAGLYYAACFGLAVLAHAPTTFPYLHDELLRQLPLELHLSPGLLLMATTAGLAAWFAIDELGPLRQHDHRRARVLRLAPRGLAVGLVAALAAYLLLRGEAPTRPFSRLDPLLPVLGAPALVLAALGLRRVIRAWPAGTGASEAWLVALAGLVVATVTLYAPRNLPRADLYYYGRYLVPELLPVGLLLAVEGLRGIHGALAGAAPSRGRRRLALAAGLAGGLGLGGTVMGVLLTHPVTRLPEFEGASRVVEHLAAALPEDAVVIAGGEGWHHGHTFNQVGGALAVGHGITVLPYRNREAAYASLHELLIGRPRATAQPAPPVYLLLNEATKHHTRDPDDPEARVRIAGLDDLLPPPFVARRIELVEMFLDRLTPTREGLPTRVTRDGLRMGLLRVEVDAARAAAVETWRLGAEGGTAVVEGPPGLALRGGVPRDGVLCLGREPLQISLPPTGGAGSGPVSLVLVAQPGTARRNPSWRLSVDGEAQALDPPAAPTRARDTLGPLVLAARPSSIVLHGSRKVVRGAACPHGGLAELRLLGPDAPMLATADVTAHTFAPARTLGHPVTPVAWVSGRGLSRYRTGTEVKPQVKGLSLVLGPDDPLRFAPAPLPDGGRVPVDLVLTLAQTSIGPNTRLELRVDGQALAPIDPPDQRRRSWQSPALRVQPRASVARIEVRLRDAGPNEQVLLRDIGLFSRASPLPGLMAAP